ncbi:MAG: flagellar biosynthesis regulator FlaF [Bdellovibrionales bacterium]
MAIQNKINAYATHQHIQETDRDIDARALLICASQLDAARNAESDRALYKDAIKRNQKLWTIFQVALCDPGNPLPVELKNILLNLSCFVDKVSFRALAEFKPAMLGSLIDINRSIAAGLSKKPPVENQPQPVAAPFAPTGSVITA